MSFGYYFHPESMSAEQYDRVVQKLDEAERVNQLLIDFFAPAA